MDRAKTLQELTVREGSSKSSGILSALIEGLPGVGLRRVGGWSRRLRYEGPGSAGAAGILRRRSGCSEAFITSPCVGWISLRAADGNWCVQPGNAVNEVPPATAMKKPFYIFRKVGPGWASVLLNVTVRSGTQKRSKLLGAVALTPTAAVCHRGTLPAGTRVYILQLVQTRAPWPRYTY